MVNRSDSVKRIRFKPPTTAEFTIHQIPSISVAPGLEISADLEFFSAVEGDFSDELIVICDDDRIVIPVRALEPRADLFFDGFCHFGGVAPDSTTIRYIDVVNRGLKSADFRFLTEQVPSCFEIDPVLGRLGAAGSDDCFIRVRVVFNAKDLGVFRSLVNMEVNSTVISTTLDMSALVVRQKVELVSPDGTGKVDALNFGTVYFGEERSQQVMFVNDGPESLEFKVSVEYICVESFLTSTACCWTRLQTETTTCVSSQTARALYRHPSTTMMTTPKLRKFLLFLQAAASSRALNKSC